MSHLPLPRILWIPPSTAALLALGVLLLFGLAGCADEEAGAPCGAAACPTGYFCDANQICQLDRGGEPGGGDPGGGVAPGAACEWSVDCPAGQSCVAGSCDVVVDNLSPDRPRWNGYRVEPAALLLTPDVREGNVRVVDRSGRTVPASSYTWVVDRNAPVQVTSDGRVRLDGPWQATSFQVMAVTNDGESLPLNVVAATPQGRAALVPDADFLSAPAGLNPEVILGEDTRWVVVVSDRVSVQPGDLLLPAESAQMAGRVESVRRVQGGQEVTLRYEEPDDMFSDLDLELTLRVPVEDLGSWEMEPGWYAEVGPQGEIVVTGDGEQKSLGGLFSCTMGGSLVQVEIGAPRISLRQSFDVDATWNRNHREVVLRGEVTFGLDVANIGINLATAGELSCSIAFARVPLTPAGIVGSLLGVPELRLGAKMKLEAETRLLSMGGAIRLEQTSRMRAGFSCLVGNCRFITESSSTGMQDRSDWSLQGPDETARVQAKVGAFATLWLVSDPAFTRARELFGAEAGPQFRVTLADSRIQLNESASRTRYDLDLVGSIGFPTESAAVERLSKWLKLSINLPRAEFRLNLASSPQATLSAPASGLRVGQPVNVQVRFDRSTFLTQHNVRDVLLYEVDRSASLTPLREAFVVRGVAAGTTEVSLSWTPRAEGEVELASFVVPRFLSFLGEMHLATQTVRVGSGGPVGTDPDPTPNPDPTPDPDPSDCPCDIYESICDDPSCTCDPLCTGGGAVPAGEGWVRIQPGTFWMGSPSGELGRFSNEDRHQVRLTRAFELMTTPVTQGQWHSLMGNNPSCFQTPGSSNCSTLNANPNAPVEGVSWWEAAGYANARSRAEGLPECYRLEGCTGVAGVDGRCTGVTITGAGGNPYNCTGYRLPTEAEWEYAARAGDTRATYNGELTATGCNDTTLLPIAWFCGNAENRTHPVGQKRANAWGLYDMLGNVWEWSHDWYTASLGSELVTDPWGPSTGSNRVFGGGSWDFYAQGVRAGGRRSGDPGGRGISRGFRLARTAP